MDLVEFFCRNDFFAVLTDDPCGNADRCGIFGNGVENYCICGNFCAFANCERSENLCTCTDNYIVHKGRVALSGFLTCTAEGDSLIDGAVVADFGGFADNNSGAVVN